jgi:hypothetical protein
VPTDRTAQTWTSAQVLSDVRRKASLPATSTDWTDAVILREATDVLWSFAGWALAQAGEGRMLVSTERAVTSAVTGAVGAREFVLPALAVGATLDMVTWTDANGRNQSRLARIDHGEEALLVDVTERGAPAMYALIGDRIRVYPLPNTGGSLRITYQRRHAELVTDQVASVATLSSVAAAGATTSTLTLAAGITGIQQGDNLDVLRATQPHAPIVAGAELVTINSATSYLIDQPIAMFTGNETLNARVVRSGQSPYVSLPLEFRAAFTEKVAANILRVVGDLQGMQVCEQAAVAELSRVLQLLSPRAKRDKPYAVNPSSHLRMRISRGRW